MSEWLWVAVGYVLTGVTWGVYAWWSGRTGGGR